MDRSNNNRRSATGGSGRGRGYYADRGRGRGNYAGRRGNYAGEHYYPRGRGHYAGRGRGRGDYGGGRDGYGGGRRGNENRQSGADGGYGRGRGGSDVAGTWSNPASPAQTAGYRPAQSESQARAVYDDQGVGTTGEGGSGGQATHQVTDTVISDMQSLQISGPSPRSTAVNSEDKIMPMQRPGKGAGSGRITELLVNHFLVNFSPQMKIWHYYFAMTLGNRSVEKIQESDLNLVREKLSTENTFGVPSQQIAYDGQKNIFSAVELDTSKPFEVDVTNDGYTNRRIYMFTLEGKTELELSKLSHYLTGNTMCVPRDVLQGMDLVMKENSSRHRISVGRSTYSKEFLEEDDLGSGIAAFRGFHQSLKPTSQGLALCLDYSVLPFRQKLPVLTFLKQHVNDFRDEKDLHNQRVRRTVESTLKGLKVKVTHRRTRQNYTIKCLTDKSAENITFAVKDDKGNDLPEKENLVNYFKKKYKLDIEHKNIPCLDVGKNNRQNYVPLEFCELVEGQRMDNLDTKTDRKLKTISVVPPPKRRERILEMVTKEDGPCGGDILKNFGIEVQKNMTSVDGHIFMPPDLKSGKVGVLKVDEGFRNLNLNNIRLLIGKPLSHWALLNFKLSKDIPENFVQRLQDKCESLGIQMQLPLVYKSIGLDELNDVNKIRQVLEDIIQEAKSPLQIAVCVMAQKHPGYKSLKYVSEVGIGLVTQCCLYENASKEKNDQILGNLILKINAKLGGSSLELYKWPDRCFQCEDLVMFVGADVNHPGPSNKQCHSIAAVVASVNWPAATQYAARVCLQEYRKEKIMKFGDMCSELVDAFATDNKHVKPNKIVVFRDGVSDSQFDMVLNEELKDLKEKIYTGNYRPKITLVVAQKRHHTRLFLKRSPSMNIKPGTVVDRIIVHPFEYDFYLCSHLGNLGTSKPTHYYVLYDDNKFTPGVLQQLIYQMCFTFARCIKPINIVPPIHYADLVAYRVRLFYDVQKNNPSTSSAQSFDCTLYRTHPSLKNIMFFI